MKYAYVLIFCLAPVFASEAPSIKTPSVLKLEPQTQGALVSATVTFSNQGNAPLTIQEIKTPCGCTKVNLEKKTYAPGETGSFEVQIRTARLSGTYDKSLTILSNDAQEPSKKVRITFDMTQPDSES